MTFEPLKNKKKRYPSDKCMNCHVFSGLRDENLF